MNITYLTKDLYPKYMKQSQNPVLKWAKNVNRHFNKEDIQMENKQMVVISIIAIREMKLKPQ